MPKTDYISKRIVKLVNVLVFLLVVYTSNSTCIWLMYQPEFPEVAKN